MSENSNTKKYIGDGAYADFDGYGIILTTEDGISAKNKVYLEPEVFENLLSYAKKMSPEIAKRISK